MITYPIGVVKGKCGENPCFPAILQGKSPAEGALEHLGGEVGLLAELGGLMERCVQVLRAIIAHQQLIEVHIHERCVLQRHMREETRADPLRKKRTEIEGNVDPGQAPG